MGIVLPITTQPLSFDKHVYIYCIISSLFCNFSLPARKSTDVTAERDRKMLTKERGKTYPPVLLSQQLTINPAPFACIYLNELEKNCNQN